MNQYEKNPMTSQAKPGDKYGLLTLIEKDLNASRKLHKWIVICECGIKKSIRLHAMISGRSLSCGFCVKKENQRKSATIHGQYGTRTYVSYRSMKNRCTNRKDEHWKDYGARGIKICPQWIESFECFLRDMGECPEGKTIDRKDTNGNYEPENCRWATSKEQGSNRRNNRIIKYNRKRQSWSGQKN